MAKRKFVLYLGLSFIFGTLAAGRGFSFFFTLGLFFVVFGLFLIFRGRRETILKAWKDLRKVIVLSCLFLVVGFFYFNFFLNIRHQQTSIPFNQPVVFEGIVSIDPRDNGEYQIVEVLLQAPFMGRVKVFADKFPGFEYGDLLEVSGQVQTSRFENDWPVVFDSKIKIIDKSQGFWIKEKLLSFKNFLVGKFPLVLSSDQSALLAGLTFGERGDFSANLKEDMARSGVTHIVALSGYNIAILALAIERAFSLFLSRRKRFYLTLGLIFLFVLMVGGEASVVRAAIMGALALLAQHIGRPHEILHLVVLTAVGMILLDPTITYFNLGFQLSFLSLLGILLIEPALRKIMNFKQERRESFLSWKENGLTTISAQLAVLPVLLTNFDYFSLTSVLANVLILFSVPLTMFLGFLLAGFSGVSIFLGFFVAKVISVLLFYQITIIKFFSKFSVSFGSIDNPVLVYVIFYGAITILILYSTKHEKAR